MARIYTAVGKAGGTEQQQSDWAQTDNTAVDFIKNKPELEPFVITRIGNGTNSYQKETDKTAEQIYNAVKEGRLIKYIHTTSIFILNPVICEKDANNKYKIAFLGANIISGSSLSTSTSYTSDYVAFTSNANSFNADWVAADNVYLSIRVNVNMINDAALKIQKNGVQVAQFTANSASNVTANITVPTQLTDLANNIDWYGTQAEFEALQSYNETTNYHIETNPPSALPFKTYDKLIKYIAPEPFYVMPLNNNGGVTVTRNSGASDINLQYSLNKTTWESVTIAEGETYSFISAANRKIYFKAQPSATTKPLEGWKFSATTQYNVGGRLLSLIYANTWMSDNTMNTSGTKKFFQLFKNETNLINANQLKMADNCTYTCYQEMFNGCTNLTAAPDLPATNLGNGEGCYQSMFNGCTNLTAAPDLPATTLKNYCYSAMFNGCSSLTSIKCLATNISATNCTANMTNGVAANGTFTKDANMNDFTTGVNGIPSGWAVVNA